MSGRGSASASVNWDLWAATSCTSAWQAPVLVIDAVVRECARGRDNDVATVAAEIDVLARHLPRPLVCDGGAEKVRVEAAGGSADQPRPPLDETGPSRTLEGTESGPSVMNVHVDHVDAASKTGRDTDVGVRPSSHHDPTTSPSALASRNPVDG